MPDKPLESGSPRLCWLLVGLGGVTLSLSCIDTLPPERQGPALYLLGAHLVTLACMAAACVIVHNAAAVRRKHLQRLLANCDGWRKLYMETMALYVQAEARRFYAYDGGPPDVAVSIMAESMAVKLTVGDGDVTAAVELPALGGADRHVTLLAAFIAARALWANGGGDYSVDDDDDDDDDDATY